MLFISSAPAAQSLNVDKLEAQMNKRAHMASPRLSLFKVLRFSAVGSALVLCLLGCPLGLVFADPLGTIDPTQKLDWVQGAVSHAQKMRAHKDADTGSQPPGVIPQFSADPDPSGQIATFQPEGSTTEGNNAFFQNLGTNGRTCFTSSAADRLDDQRRKCSGAVRGECGRRSTLPSGRRCHVSDRGRLEPRGQT